MAMDLEVEGKKKEEAAERQYMKGVKQLCESGIKKVPNKYILPVSERPRVNGRCDAAAQNLGLKLPIIDLSLLHSNDRASVIQSLEKACEEYGFFQVVNHGIPVEVIKDMVDVVKRFFELPFEERSKYMSSDIRNPVRYGTSFNQMNDKVFSWRDFLKLSCHPISSALPYWPSSPVDLREKALLYAKEMKSLFTDLMEAILETLGVNRAVLEEFRTGSHMIVANCYPVCPEPGLTLGMPPHSDYGFLTLLLQDDVKGLQIQHGDEWVTVQPVPDSLVVNIDIQQREVQERATPGVGQPREAPNLRRFPPQPPHRSLRRALPRPHRRQQPAAVHGHRLRLFPRLHLLARIEAQELPRVKEVDSWQGPPR